MTMHNGYPRRLRRTGALRAMFAETRLDPAQLVLPLFVKAGISTPQEVASMPGVWQHTAATAADAADRAHAAGVGGVILFGIPDAKDAQGSSGWDPAGPVPRAATAIRQRCSDELVIWADVCQCEYTDHGQCGPLASDGAVDNDAAVAGYVRDALAYVHAGVDVVAPSGMMDGQVAALRAALDGEGRRDVAIVAYAAKFASAFYGPFRDAAESSLEGDRSTHQLDPGNRREARRELQLDLEEGADVLMVKPALPYLDIVADARRLGLPVAAYHVSGEYAMIKAAGERGWLDADAALTEAAVSIVRAGADLVLTYDAVRLAQELR
ncbi:MAG: porphobilinogen synthase [Nitriliruptoraceae bacterium]